MEICPFCLTGMCRLVKSNVPLEVKWENRLDGLPYLITGKDNTSLGFGDYTGRPPGSDPNR